MKKNKKIVVSAIICLSCFLVGCGKKEAEATTEEEAIQWEFNKVEDKETAEYDDICSTLIKDISSLDWIESVSVVPGEGKSATITCFVVEGKEITDGDIDAIETYIDSLSYFEKYTLSVN